MGNKNSNQKNQEYISEMNRIKVSNVLIAFSRENRMLCFLFWFFLDGSLDSNALSDKRAWASSRNIQIERIILLAWRILQCVLGWFIVQVENFGFSFTFWHWWFPIYSYLIGYKEKITIKMISFMFSRYKITKRTTNLMAVVPLTFLLAYYADLAYGSKLHRIRGMCYMNGILARKTNLLLMETYFPNKNLYSYVFSAEADMIMQNESDLLEWPNGLPTVSGIDEARVHIEMLKKLHPNSSWIKIEIYYHNRFIAGIGYR